MMGRGFRKQACRRLGVGLWIFGAFLGLGAVGASASVEIRGSVLGPDDKALAGARVALHPVTSRFVTGDHLLAGRPGAPAVKEVTTGEDGSFRLLAPEAGMWRLQVSAEGLVPAQMRLTPLLEAIELDPVKLAVDVGLRVRIVDPDRQPVADAAVVVYRRRPRPSGGRAVDREYPRPVWYGAPFLGRADESGWVRVPAAERDEMVFQVVAEGLPQRLGTLSRTGDGEEVFELLGAPAGLFEVLDHGGRPVPGALLFADSQPYPIGRAGEDGRVLLALRPDRKTRLTVVTADHRWGAYQLDPVAAPDPESPEAAADTGPETLVVQDPIVIRGRVIDNVSRDPLPGALVWPTPYYGRAVSADRGGAFTLEVEGETAHLHTGLAGYRPAEGMAHFQVMRPAAQGNVDDLTLTLQPLTEVSGRVVDGYGDGVEGVEILPIPGTGRGPGDDETFQVVTGKGGAFSLDRLFVDVPYRVRLRAGDRLVVVDSDQDPPAYADTWVDLTPLEPGEERGGLVWTLDFGRHGEGWVVDENDVPVVGAEVRLRRDSGFRRFRGRMTELAPDLFQTTTDAEGRFLARNVPAERYDLLVAASGFAPARVPGIELPAEEARLPGPWELGTVTLGPAVSIVGKVQDEAGRGIEGVAIHARKQGSNDPIDFTPAEKLQTDAEGRFRIDDLAVDETLTLHVRSKSYLPLRGVTVRAPEDDLRLTLERGSTITGRVVDPEGRPVRDARVGFHSDSRIDPRQWGGSTSTEADGTFELSAVQSGKGKLSVVSTEYRNYTREVRAPGKDDPPLHVDVTLERGLTVIGRVVDDRGEGVGSAHVNVEQNVDDGPSDPRFARTDGDGRFEVRGLSSGEVTLSAFSEAYRSVRETVELVSDGQYVELVFETGFPVTGRVVSADGSPVPEITVMVSHQEGRPTIAPTNTDRSGRFRLQNVAAGDYRISAVRSDGRRVEEELRVDGPTEGLELVLDAEEGTRVVGRIEGLSFDDLARVQISAQGSNYLSGRVSYDGSFEIPGLTEGAWQIIASIQSDGRQAEERLEITAGQAEAEVDLEFRPGYELRGIVRIDGEPPFSMNISLSGGESRQPRNTRTLHDGSFRFADLPAGEYQLFLYGSMGEQFRRTVTVDGDREIVIEPKASRVSGSVLDSEGRPIQGAEVYLSRVDGPESRTSVATSSEGRFVFGWVEEGEWRLSVRQRGYREAVSTLSVVGGPGGGREGLEIRLESAASFSFRVQGVESGPLFYVVTDESRRRVDGGFLSGAADGVFSLDTVPPGRWRLWLQRGTGFMQAFPIEVGSPGGGPTPVFALDPVVVVQIQSLSGRREVHELVVLGPQGPLPLSVDPQLGMQDHVRLTAGRGLLLPPGTWTVVTRDPDGVEREQVLNLVPGVEGAVVELP